MKKNVDLHPKKITCFKINKTFIYGALYDVFILLSTRRNEEAKNKITKFINIGLYVPNLRIGMNINLTQEAFFNDFMVMNIQKETEDNLYYKIYIHE